MAAFDEAREELAELDRRAGDGDFATNLRSALQRAREHLDGAQAPADVFGAMATAFLHTGGTSGPLFGLWFRELARAAAGPALALPELVAGVQTGTAGVQRVGGARVGDKTMIDALAPAGDALARAATLEEGLAAAAAAARAGAESTRSLVARRGRATYVGEAGVGIVDPGAAAVALLFEAAT